MNVVQYHKEYKNEEPFMMNGEKWVYCWGKYPNGKIDIAVYRYATDMAYDYNDFRAAMGIDKNNNKLNENMENAIKDKVMRLKGIQGELDGALKAYNDAIVELEKEKGGLVSELMNHFKKQTTGAKKLKISLDGIILELVQEHEKTSVSHKNAFDTALTKVNENTKKVLEQILENSKVLSKVKGQLKIDGSKIYENVGDMFDKVKGWLDKAHKKITGFTEKAEEGVGELEDLLAKYDEEEANKYATPNMDDIEMGITESELRSLIHVELRNAMKEINESNTVKNAATRHIIKGMGDGTSATRVGKLPTTGGQSIKNAATKNITKSKGETLKGEKSLEEPKKENGSIKNAATKNIKGGKTEGPASQNIQKQPTTGGQSIKNAATKNMTKTGATKLSTTKPKVVSEDLDTNDGINKIYEDGEIIKNAATKNIEGGKTEVGGKISGLKNMEEESWTENSLKEERKDVSEKTRATIEKWIANFGHRGAAKKLINFFIGKMAGGLGTDDLPDTSTFADGLDEIEGMLNNPEDYYDAVMHAKETAETMLSEEGFAEDMFDEGEKIDNDGEEFTPHGSYTLSNTGGYEIMLSDDGSAAKVRDAFGSDNPETSDWLEIEYIHNPETDEDEPIIDPNGYNIPLNNVMRLNRESWMKMRAGAKGKVYEGKIDMEKTKDGYLLLSKRLKNGDLFKRKYMDYTEKEAKDKFKAEFEKEENSNSKLNEAINRFKNIINYGS